MTATPAALQAEGQAITDELRALLAEARLTASSEAWRDELALAARQRVDAIAARVREAAAEAERSVEPRLATLRERFGQLAGAMERAAPAVVEGSPTGRAEGWGASWEAFRREVQPAVDALAESLKELPARPSNARRMVLHVCMGLTTTALVYLLPRFWLILCPGVVALFAWSAEISRARSPRINAALMRFFGPVAHAHEWRRVNSSTWFATAMLLLAIVAPRVSCALATLTLGLGDPAAALIGRRWGRTKLRSNRSLEGTLTFVAVAALACFALLRVMHPQYGLYTAAMAALVAGVSGALAEAYSTRIDDNFSIPVSVAAATAAVFALLG